MITCTNAGKFYRRPETLFPGDASLRQGHGQTALGTIVRAADQSGADEGKHRPLDGAFPGVIQPRRPARLAAVDDLQEMAAAEVIRPAQVADEQDHVARRLEKLRRHVRRVLDQADHAAVGVGSTTPAGLSL